ncbi:hypothetical protein AJ79_03675 [Helicocarpus griseus UAMH5409]|uniref:holo-[acyl-carrier-protein] synthase n=1 Tax=Helicocarpus griseus UAMH5409 TaxID=1447875 RepID=A0A2B7XW30_9EURO|nr:hypothetical protein AJ79_03675 [Helicocarpus griseus UAMH5409]
MSSLPSPSTSSPPILTRWYIDTRPLTATTASLPLLSTLQEPDQTTIKAFYHLSDRHMSLASYLLKYLFIHRTCRVPWSQIIISRTPAPHKRPCYIPLQQQQQQQQQQKLPGEKETSPIPIPNIEFNVSHQASLVALAGCIHPTGPTEDDGDMNLSSQEQQQPRSPSANNPSIPQIGIDITCTDDPARRNRGVPKTEAELRDFIDIFAEVFSQNEIDAMKAYPAAANLDLQASIKYRVRLFYTYWALKEAYIKMTGEALLAPWLRDLEFRDVVIPSPPSSSASLSSGAWGVPETGVKAVLYGREVADVRLEVVAFGEDYIFATAGRGGGFGTSVAVGGNGELRARWDEFRRVDIEKDVEPCARGDCGCLT